VKKVRKDEIIAVASVVVAIALPFTLLGLTDSTSEKIVIRAYVAEAGGFRPDYIVIPQGSKVKIVFESVDVTHGVIIPELGIDTGPVKAGERVIIEFSADRKGTYHFLCSIRCSPFHQYMKGVIVVK